MCTRTCLFDRLRRVTVLVAYMSACLHVAVVLCLQPEWKIADPICTFLFSVLVVITTVTILRDTLNVLMEGTVTILRCMYERHCSLHAICARTSMTDVLF